MLDAISHHKKSKANIYFNPIFISTFDLISVGSLHYISAGRSTSHCDLCRCDSNMMVIKT